MYQVAPRMLASSGSTVASRLAALIAFTPVSPRTFSGCGSGVGPATEACAAGRSGGR